MPNVHFCTFLTVRNNFSPSYDIVEAALKTDVFDQVHLKTEDFIDDYIESRAEWFRKNPIGFGLFLWQPVFLKRFLESVDDGDIVVYANVGVKINTGEKAVKRLHEYVSFLKDPNKDMVLFGFSDRYRIHQYCKKDVIMECFPNFYELPEPPFPYAGIGLYKKTATTLRFLSEYQSLCEVPGFLLPGRSTKYKDDPRFLGHDKDNGVFGVCSAKYSRHIVYIEPHESNLFLNGVQYEHLSPADRKGLSWESLSDYPLVCARLRSRDSKTTLRDTMIKKYCAGRKV